MHEEESVKRNIDAVIIRTGQLVLDPSAAFIKSLLRKVAQVSGQAAHGAMVTATGFIPNFGEVGLVSATTLHRMSQHGKGSQPLKDANIDAFTRLMTQFKIPITVLTEPERGEKFVEYRTEDEQAVLTGLQECAKELLKKERGLGERATEEQLRAIEREVENVADPRHALSEDEVLAGSDFAWDKNVEGGYETSTLDDLGRELHCLVDDTGRWRVWTPDSGAVEGTRVLSAGGSAPGETQSLGDALLQACGALQNLKKGEAYQKVEKYSLKTPEMQRQVAQRSIAKSSGSTRDLGNRQHQGI